jgi:TolB-like protein/DNA-binding winged helix-turn-helix (wHTH) protein
LVNQQTLLNLAFSCDTESYFPRAGGSLSGPVYHFGDFWLDCGAFQLLRNGQSVRVERKPMELLILLASREGQLVTRSEIADRLWESEVFVDTEHGINTAIRKLRYQLRDDPDNPQFIQTVIGRGYRFIAPITTVQKPSSEAFAPGAALVEAASMDPAEPKDVISAEALTGAPTLPTPNPRYPVWVGLTALAALLITIPIATLGAHSLGERLLHRNAPPVISSLAVLPLDNLSGDSTQDYFADGMTDELITMLAKDSSLRIVSRTSVMQYRGARRPLPEIARALHADAIVEGSVTRSANQVHMTLQLIRAETDSHLWADSYERDANDLALPDEAAKAIANQLQRAVPAAKVNRYVNPAAHDAYLHGNYLWLSDHMDQSGGWFRKAIDLQPDYALAWAGLADYYGEGIAGDVLDPRTSIVPEEQAAERALALDPNLPQAHQAMAAMFLLDRWDWADADREILRALSLDTQNSELYYLQGCVLQAVKRDAEAIEVEKKAMEIDPFSRPYALAGFYMGARQFDAALKEIQLRLEANPNNLDLLGLEADVWRRMGKHKEAVDTWARLDILTGDSQSAVNMRRAWDRGGARGEVRWQLARRLLQAKNRYVSPVELASYYAQLGDKERTLALLEEGYQQHATDTLWIQQDPAYDFLRSDSRFRSIVQRIEFAPAH